MKRALVFASLLSIFGAGVAILYATKAHAAFVDTARAASWTSGEAFMRMNGSPIHRFTLTPDNTTAVTYTLFGGERICLQALTTDAYIEVIAAASVTAAGAKGFTLVAGQGLFANCFTLEPGQLSVSALCTAAGPCLVKGLELK
jgi:hypothetical protein